MASLDRGASHLEVISPSLLQTLIQAINLAMYLQQEM